MLEAPALFGSATWQQALAQYSAATNLTVELYAPHGGRLGIPSQPTPLWELFVRRRADAWFGDPGWATRSDDDPAERVTIRERHGLATVSVPLRRDRAVVALAVAGAVLVRHLDESGAAALARAHELPFETVRSVVRRTMPVSRQRLALCGELLATLTEALLREEARARALEGTSAELAETLRLKEEFLAVLSHELRTPLTPILSWTQVLKLRPDPRLVPRVVDVIERNVRRQIELVNDLLDLNRIQRGKVTIELESVDMRDIVRAAVDTVTALAEQRQLAIERHEPDHPVLIEADASRLTQVFANALANAIKFTGPGGRIVVSVATEGDRAVGRVRDTGVGIRPEFLPFVFDMFRQEEEGGRRQHGGLGIGLAVARRLTELHGGTIRATSDGPGKGTEIVVSLPLLANEAAVVSASGSEHRQFLPAFDRLSVLVIEDMDDTRAATAAMLEELGATVTLAGDGEEGVRQFQASPPDVVVCDLRMPALDGFEVLARLRTTAPGRQVPVIACSGLVTAEDEHKVRAAGFAAYLGKPFDFEALSAALESVGARPGSPRSDHSGAARPQVP